MKIKNFFFNKAQKKLLQSFKAKKGIAVIEFMLMFFVYVFLLVVLYGSWGIVHSGVLNSISARYGAFKQIAHRSDLSFYYSDVLANKENILKHSYFTGNHPLTGKKAIRVFGVVTKKNNPEDDPKWKPVELRMDVGGAGWNNSTEKGILGFDRSRNKEDFNNPSPVWAERIELGSGPSFENRHDREFKTSAVELKQVYGICLDFHCGGPP